MKIGIGRLEGERFMGIDFCEGVFPRAEKLEILICGKRVPTDMGRQVLAVGNGEGYPLPGHNRGDHSDWSSRYLTVVFGQEGTDDISLVAYRLVGEGRSKIRSEAVTLWEGEYDDLDAKWPAHLDNRNFLMLFTVALSMQILRETPGLSAKELFRLSGL